MFKSELRPLEINENKQKQKQATTKNIQKQA